MVRFLLFLVLIALTGCAANSSQRAQPEKVRRVPMQKSNIAIQSPAKYEKRGSTDPKTGKPVSYDPKPQVIVVDAKAGKYQFRWIGYDGKEKVIEYQRADAIDVLVSASAKRTDAGQYLYTYSIENLPSSATYISHFIVQNFAADTRPIEINGKATTTKDISLLKAFRNATSDSKSGNIEGMFIGEMSNDIYRFSEGNWISFGILPEFKPAVVPGQKIEIKLLSDAPPGLVGCSATGGERTLKGVGEHMPTELEDMLPGYEGFPGGSTIGPVDSLKTLSSAQKASYLRERLGVFKKLGWITSDASQRYEKSLKEGDIEAVVKSAGQDLSAEQITSEVFAIIQAMKQ